MHCPFCQAQDTKVIDSRLVGDGTQIRREENASSVRLGLQLLRQLTLPPRIIKSDGKDNLLMVQNSKQECSEHLRKDPYLLKR